MQERNKEAARAHRGLAKLPVPPRVDLAAGRELRPLQEVVYVEEEASCTLTEESSLPLPFTGDAKSEVP